MPLPRKFSVPLEVAELFLDEDHDPIEAGEYDPDTTDPAIQAPILWPVDGGGL